VLEMKYAMFVSSEPRFSTIVPGTMLMLSSLASEQYASRYFWYCEQRGTGWC
jgi:hypothetical protein